MNATNHPDFRHPEFLPTFERVVWRKPDGFRHWTQVYAPSDDACRWDDTEWATAAIGINHLQDPHAPAFAYCELKVTGRKDRLIPGTGGYADGAVGRKARITFNKGTPDEDTFDCWVVRDDPKELN